MKKIPEKITLSETELEDVMSLAASNFSPELIAKKLGCDKESFLMEFNNKLSDLRQAYDAGKLNAQYEIMKKQLELAKSGNITAAQIFLKESKEIEIENIRNQCFFG